MSPSRSLRRVPLSMRLRTALAVMPRSFAASSTGTRRVVGVSVHAAFQQHVARIVYTYAPQTVSLHALSDGILGDTQNPSRLLDGVAAAHRHVGSMLRHAGSVEHDARWV